MVIAIGNSHLRWAEFDRQGLGVIHCHSVKDRKIDRSWLKSLPRLVVVASVVPPLTEVIAAQLAEFTPKILTLADIPLGNMYPTLGIDRAIGAWQAVQMYGAPVLVIDGGTAISLTAIDRDSTYCGIFVGGAILAGRAMQLSSLHTYTAGLPHLELPTTTPPLWGQNTVDSIYTGINQGSIGAVGKFLEQWAGQVVFTGGDGAFLHQALGRGHWVPNLVLLGMRQLLLPLLP